MLLLRSADNSLRRLYRCIRNEAADAPAFRCGSLVNERSFFFR